VPAKLIKKFSERDDSAAPIGRRIETREAQ
jgi:hypothetical protein